MGRVIKKDEQSDVTSASLDEEDFREEATPNPSSRIPAEKVDPPAEDTRSSEEASPAGRVLRADQTQKTPEPVPVEPVSPDPESESSAASSPGENTGEEEGKEGEDEEDDFPERTDAEWQEHLEEAVEDARTEGYETGYEEGYEAGYDDGYEEAETTLRAEWQEEREELIDDTAQFEELWTQYIEDNESRFVELALHLAEAIVDAPISDSLREALEEALTEAVAELAGTPPVTITVHPVDYQRLQESGLAEHLTEKYEELQLESDPECTEGDWSVSSPAGVIRRRRSEVLETLRDRLSLSASGPTDSGT
ncbi:MAG: FliH/SctL family protein [Salinibacter sp.]